MSEENFPQLVTSETAAFLQQARETAAEYARNSKAANTWRAYQADLRDFTAWCRAHGLNPLPTSPETVAAYLVDLATRRKVATVQRRLASISQQHAAAGHETPTRSATVRLIMQGIRRTHAPAQAVRKVQPAVTSIICKLVDALGDSLIDRRDRALILIGFAGAFRRSELAQFRLGDITETEDGLRVMLRQSKTDQEGAGLVKGIPRGHDPKTCPVRAWRDWIAAAGIEGGQAFRSVNRHGHVGASLSGRAIADMIKSRVKAIDFDSCQFSGHSLRSGLITAAAKAGVPERIIMKQSGHKHLPTLRGYIREGSLFTENAAAQVGL
jgi:site-specific recombinase XerD